MLAWIVAAALVLELSVAWSAAPSNEAAVLQQRIERTLTEVVVTGATWATVDSDGKIHAGAAGLKNAISGEALAADSRMHVGSIAKTLVATGVLQLASDGRIDLDAPVSAYLPALAFDNPWPDQPVRVRHLLDHTAGLDDLRLWQMFSARATPDTRLQDAFARDASLLSIRSLPGSRFSYSNMGYTLAAMLIEAVTRERYETWLDRELLRPLDMHDSTFAFTSQVGAAADPRLAWGHLDLATPAPALPAYLRPAGQFTTTAQDLAKFAIFLMSDGRIAGRTIVKPGHLRAMGRASGTEAAQAGLQAGYALGLERRDRHGAIGLCHGGDVVGFHARLCVFPPPADSSTASRGTAFVVLLNSDCDGLDCGRFDALLVDALALPAPHAMPATQAPDDVADWEGRYVPAPNRMASFRYLDFLFDSPRLVWTGEALRLIPTQGPTRVLTPAGGHAFIADQRQSASHALLHDDNGSRVLSDGLRSHRQIHPALYWLVAASLACGVLGLLWFALVVPARALLRRESAADPGVVGAWLLVLPLPLFLLQSYTRLGDRTLASVALYAVTAALPALMVWQACRSLRRHEGIAHGRINLAAALLVLQWCGVLAAWGMLPFALWR